MLPYYGVFDNLAYRVDGNTVTLLGQVTRPTLKSDAEKVVKDIEGVEKVNNQIEVLPLSPMAFGRPSIRRGASHRTNCCSVRSRAVRSPSCRVTAAVIALPRTR